MTREAILPSKIEDTQATIDEVYGQDAGVSFSEHKEEDIRKIKNYRTALRFASHSLNEKPLTLGLVREIHRIMRGGVRGSGKSPGLFREKQNWTGPRDCATEQATYLPPDPVHVNTLMKNWLEYMANQTQIAPLAQSAVIHVQFEMIHPFLDGNGRIGCLMIPIFPATLNPVHHYPHPSVKV